MKIERTLRFTLLEKQCSFCFRKLQRNHICVADIFSCVADIFSCVAFSLEFCFWTTTIYGSIAFSCDVEYN